MMKDNIQLVEDKICAACRRSGRRAEEVTLIAVSKTKPVEAIREAMKSGIIDFGENKVQELVHKTESIKENLNWHLIGHLQRNKVKYVIDKVCLIHSVDSYRLAEQVQAEALKVGRIINILIQVNVAKEDSKFGITAEQASKLISQISKLSNIRVKGLMMIAPSVDNPEDNRIYFKNLKKLYVDIKSKNIDNVNMEILSMGMTGDYEVAIEEGATMIRVGTGIFGERNYE